MKWRKQYNESGIEPLLKHGRVGGFITAATNSLDAEKIKTTCGFPIYARRFKLD